MLTWKLGQVGTRQAASWLQCAFSSSANRVIMAAIASQDDPCGELPTFQKCGSTRMFCHVPAATRGYSNDVILTQARPTPVATGLGVWKSAQKLFIADGKCLSPRS
jgi:hypothetical protein